MKKIFVLFLLLCSFCNFSLAKPKKECINLTYDIEIFEDFVNFTDKKNSLKIDENGTLFIGNRKIKTDESTQKKAKDFFIQTKEGIPFFEQKSHYLLSDIYASFLKIIKSELNSDKHLMHSLDELNLGITDLLKKTILTKDGNIFLLHKKLNILKKEIKDVSKKTFFNALYKEIKNISSVKEVAENSWEEERIKLIVFEEEICNFINFLDGEREYFLSLVRH